MNALPDRLSRAGLTALKRVLGDRGLVRLTDGARVLVRPLGQGDREGLRKGLAALSSRTRYLRFHGAGPKPTEADLDQLLHLDGRDRVAWGAVDPFTGCGLGLARYVRVTDRSPVAEFALTVVDQWQRRGVARVLLDRLARTAEAAGIERFSAIVLADNRLVLDWARSRGAAESQLPECQVELELPVAACRLGWTRR